MNATTPPPSLEIIARYVAALSAGNYARMQTMRAPDFVLDWVHGDAFADTPVTNEQMNRFWPVWFAAFPEMDYEVTRTIAAETVVVTQWVFSGTHAAPLGPPVFDPALPPGGKTIRFRGVSIYDITAGLIQRETMYIDLATLMVELGVTP